MKVYLFFVALLYLVTDHIHGLEEKNIIKLTSSSLAILRNILQELASESDSDGTPEQQTILTELTSYIDIHIQSISLSPGTHSKSFYLNDKNLNLFTLFLWQNHVCHEAMHVIQQGSDSKDKIRDTIAELCGTLRKCPYLVASYNNPN